MGKILFFGSEYFVNRLKMKIGMSFIIGKDTVQLHVQLKYFFL